MINMWANFARTGDTCIDGMIEWPAWEERSDQYLYITEAPQVREGFSKILGPDTALIKQ